MLTVIKARKILGNKYSNWTDKEIETIIIFLYNLCKGVIKEVINKDYENQSNNLLPGVIRKTS